MPLPLSVSCCSKIQIGFTFLVPAHPGSPGQRAIKRVCVYMDRYLQQKQHTLSFIEMAVQFCAHKAINYSQITSKENKQLSTVIAV